MIRKDTVFIIGAGASFHYGYPTGEGLVTKILDMAERLAQYCKNRLESGQITQFIPDYVEEKRGGATGIRAFQDAWTYVYRECIDLRERLNLIRPLLIDSFLAWNESLIGIGKLMIAAVILECEANSVSKLHMDNDWHRFLVHKLASECKTSKDLLGNRVKFIIFNYDMSLEFNLYSALTSTDLFAESDVRRFLSQDRIVHVYGKVNQEIPKSSHFIDKTVAGNLDQRFMHPLSHQEEFGPRKSFLDRCLIASMSLRTIDPHDKDENDHEIVTSRKWIDKSEVLYILGYGFDETNSRRIGLEAAGLPSQKTVMFTNFQNKNTINKKAARLFATSPDAFVKLSIVAAASPNQGYWEKSERGVYEAFANDFDAPEQGSPLD